MNVKLPLYRFDDNQTYDALIYSNVLNKYNYFVNSITNNRFISMGINLIDRFTPKQLNNLDSYSTICYEFAKKLSRSGSGYLFGELEQFQRFRRGQQGNFIPDPPTDFDVFEFPETIDIKINPNTVAYVSWFDASEGETIKVFNKVELVIDNSSDKTIIKTLKLNNIAFNSFSIIGGNIDLSSITAEQLKAIDYNQLTNNLNYIYDLTGFVDNAYTVMMLRNYPLVYYGYAAEGGVYEYDMISARQLPSNWYFASLIYANNNPWGTVPIKIDKGKKPKLRAYAFGNIQEYSNAPLIINESINTSYPQQTITTATDGDGEIIQYYYFNNPPAPFYAPMTSVSMSVKPDAVFRWAHDITFVWNFETEFIEQSELASKQEIDNILLDCSLENPENPNYCFDVMPDSIRIKEIHAALQADKFAVDDKLPNTPRVANLGYYIERIARILGISVNSDGSIRSVRQRELIIPDAEGNASIPAGWGRGQWQINKGGDSKGQKGGKPEETRDGIVYANRCNRNVPSDFNDELAELQAPAYVLCENIMQYIESYLEDLDQGLNWQEMGAMALPAAFDDDDGTRKYCTYEGMGTLLAEVAYMLSSISQSTSQTFISSLVTQGIAKAILESTGVPLHTMTLELQNQSDEGEQSSVVPFPALAADSPTIVQLLLNIIENQARILGSNANLKKS